MKILLQRIGLSIATLALSSTAFVPLAYADLGRSIPYGPFSSSSPDSGTCGNFWANDTFDRTFYVNPSIFPGPSYHVTEKFTNGQFITNAGQSPEGCGKDPGGTVGAGIPGDINQGYFNMVITSGVYNPSTNCTAANCGTTASFVATVFGPTAQYAIPTFYFEYTTAKNGSWINASQDLGSDRGDITGLYQP